MKQDTINPANATTSKSNHSPVDSLALANKECIAENFDKAELLLAGLPVQTKESVLLQSKIYYLTDRLDKCNKLIQEATSDGLLSKNDYQKTALLGWVLLKESKLDEAFVLFNSVFNCWRRAGEILFYFRTPGIPADGAAYRVCQNMSSPVIRET